jgi:hypothetical protein
MQYLKKNIQSCLQELWLRQLRFPDFLVELVTDDVDCTEAGDGVGSRSPYYTL